ncbi:MAG: FAD:protein FMN transferase [Bacteroidales bacterium]|nr:FAD:protein FMN transferase [Bacteroidales bacterium]
MKKIFLQAALLLSTVIIAVCMTGCGKNQEKRFTFDGMTQGTYFHIVVYAHDSTGIRQGIDKILSQIDNSLSLWNENSVLSRVNRNEDVELDSAFIENFDAAQYFSSLTDGAFDITVGELVRKHGFAEKNREKLSANQIDSLLSFTGYKTVKREGNRLIKNDNRTKLDFNAIAQGYTSDNIAQYLHSQNIHSFIVDVGGEVMCGNKKPAAGKWSVGIQNPEKLDASFNDASIVNIYLENESVVTSGNYRKFYVENGVKYSHTIDPKTGRPVTHSLLSASVIANNATTADALATAFMVMGLEKSRQFLQQHKEYAAFMIYSDSKGNMQTWQSGNFKKYTQNTSSKQ